MRPDLYLVILGMAAVTYVTRFPPLWLAGRIKFPPRLLRGLSFMPVGVFSAIIATQVLFHQGVHRFNLFLPAAVLALGVAWWTKKPLWSMLAGVAGLALLRALWGA